MAISASIGRIWTTSSRPTSLLSRIGATALQHVTFNSMGRAHHNLGNHQQAITCYQQALHLARKAGDRYTEAETLAQLGETQHAAGQPDTACDSWHRALAIFDDIGHPAAAAIRAMLSAHGPVRRLLDGE